MTVSYLNVYSRFTSFMQTTFGIKLCKYLSLKKKPFLYQNQTIIVINITILLIQYKIETLLLQKMLSFTTHFFSFQFRAVRE